MVENLWGIVFGLALYFGILLIIGYYGWKSSKTGLEDFFLAGRSFGSFFIVMTLMASTLSAVLYLGGAASYYSQGVGFNIIMSEHVLVAFIFYLVGSRMWYLGREHGYLNITDLIADRYQSRGLALLLSIFMIIGIVPYLGAQLRGAGISLESLTSGIVPFDLGVVLFVLIIGGYAFAGGFRAVVLTDVFQGLIMIVALYAAMFMIAGRVSGGLIPMMNQVAHTHPEVLSIPGPNNIWAYPALLSAYLLWGLGTIMRADISQRMYAARSAKDFKQTVLFHPLAILIMTIPPFFIGMAGRVYFSDGGLSSPDALFPTLVSELLPPALGVVILIGLLASMMSTADSQLLSGTSIFMKDIYQRFINETANDQKITSVSRWAVVIFLIASVCIVLYGPATIVGLLANVSFPIWVQGFPILVGGLFWKRGNLPGAIACLLVGETLLLLQSVSLITLPTLAPGLWALIFGTCTYVAVSLLTPPQDIDTLERFFGPTSQSKSVTQGIKA